MKRNLFALTFLILSITACSRPPEPPTIQTTNGIPTALTEGECTALGGTVENNSVCVGGKMCKTVTVSMVTKEQTTHTLCLSAKQ